MKKFSKNLQQIVKLLNDGEFHDGTSVGKQFSMTRAGIWKTIKKLQDYGVEIKSAKGKGYRLVEPLILLDKNAIKKSLKNKIKIEVLESISSTMDYFKNNTDHKNIQACLAELQTAGRGRFNRHWQTPFAQNISLSLCYPFAKDISQLAGLSTVIGLSICQTLKNYALTKPLKLKWPNDIIYADKKLGGVLIEIEAESNGWCHAIIGIGLNVNLQHQQQPSISQPWTSLREASGQYIDRNILSAELINDLLKNLEFFSESGLKGFMQEWETYDYLQEKIITLTILNKKITGVAKGISPQGHLLLQQKDGEVIECSSGNASIAKSMQK